jgi:hypothetical protein
MMLKFIEVMASIPRDTMAMAFRRAFNMIKAVEDDDDDIFTVTKNKIQTLMNISRKFC